jgi:hypothetical protein
VSAGVYTFAAADAGITMFISYQYTATSSVAKKISVLNVPMGYAPTFRCDLMNSKNGGFIGMSLYSAISTKFTMQTKLDDFLIPEFDFECYADSAGRVYDLLTSE